MAHASNGQPRQILLALDLSTMVVLAYASPHEIVAVDPELSTSGGADTIVDFDDLLQGKTAFPLTLDGFTRFLDNVEFSAENIRFYMDVVQYEEACESGSCDVVKRLLTGIVEKYIKDDAPEMININGCTRQRILDEFEAYRRVEPSRLQSAKQETYRMMRHGAFPRWIDRQVTQNLGAKGICLRRNCFFASSVVLLTSLSLMVGLRASILYRLLLILPCLAVGYCFENWRSKFCIIVARRGETADVDGTIRPIQDEALKRKAKAYTQEVVRRAFCKSIALFALIFCIPDADGRWNV
ncbi:RGS domain-containing protein [Plasmodiophora brassicae]|uniref:RGS domain-containing protein n=1 Tax=Plasmodiophora brassicae TaxID=37360 RepID=A0A0G4J2X2_PLABS|nr:hypothetical protein PBRA_008815 [Plasmodiophora brassicae]SPQ96559.1 unnamed protein product [Plasmodiophora brassicae]